MIGSTVTARACNHRYLVDFRVWVHSLFGCADLVDGRGPCAPGTLPAPAVGGLRFLSRKLLALNLRLPNLRSLGSGRRFCPGCAVRGWPCGCGEHVDLRVRACPVDLRGRGGRMVGTVRSLNGATILLEVGVVAERGDGQPPLAWAEPGPGCLVPHIREPRNRSRAVLVDEHAPLTGPRPS